ncbi:MAG: hypothetical protein ACFFFG_10740 [Candidatus Thorarchaeota archaeon]
MSSFESIPPNRQFQFLLTIEEWMGTEFERVAIQHPKLLDIIDQVRFCGVNGLIQQVNRKISPFCFQEITENQIRLLVIAFSIPIFQSLDAITIQTGMEYFSNILKYILCENYTTQEAENAAFDDIKRLHPIRKNNEEIAPYQDFVEKIEGQMRMKVRLGLPIIPISQIEEKVKTERLTFLDEMRKAKRALGNIKSNLREYSKEIATQYRINVAPYLFQTSLENLFQPLYIPIFTLNSTNRANEIFSVLVLTEEVVKRVNSRQLEVLIAYEIIGARMRSKFSRGPLEREIFLIISKDEKSAPEDYIEKELSKFFDLKEIREAQNTIQNIVESLIEESYPLMILE